MLRFQDIQPVVPGKAAIHPHPQGRRGKCPPQPTEQGPQEPTRAALRRTVPGPQHDRDQILFRFVVEGQCGHQRQVAPGVVVAVEEGQRLLPVCGIIGGIQIDRDPLSAALESLLMLRDHGRRQCAPHPIQLPGRHRILKPGEGRLRGQGRASHRIAPHRQFLEGIVGQPGGIVRVLVAADYAENPLPEQVAEWMADLVRVPAVDQTGRQLVGHLEAVIERFEQHDAPIGTGLRLIEPGHHRLQVVMEFEGDLRYTVCRHRVPPSLYVEAAWSPLL